MNALARRISKIGISESDTDGFRFQKNFLTYLAIFLSLGVFTWGIISIYHHLMIQSLVSFGFILVSFINIAFFAAHKNFKIARAVQMFVSLVFPFIFQALLGGIAASGVFMIWATLALIVSLTFRDMTESVLWLILFLGLTVSSVFLEGHVKSFKPEVLQEYSVVFTAINISVLSSILFGMMIFFVKTQIKMQSEFSNNFELLKKKEEELLLTAKKQSEDAEKLYHAQAILEEQNQKLEDSDTELRSITKKQLSINERLLGSQDELKAQEIKFRSVVENAPLIIHTIDSKGIFKLSEGGILHKIGLRPGQVVGTNALTMYRDNPVIFKSLRASLAGESKSLITNLNNHIFESHFIPIRDQFGKVIGALYISNDITEQQKAERELEKTLLRAKNSEESLRAVAEEQLEASERLLEAEERLQKSLIDEKESKLSLQKTQSQLVNNEKMASLGQLTAGIAHEINNPINFVYNGIDTLQTVLDELLYVLNEIRANARAEDRTQFWHEFNELQKEYDLDEISSDAQELVSEVRNGAIRTMDIVKGLRVFSRLDEEEQKPANINENLDATLILLQNRIENKVEINKHYDATMEEVLCYPGKLNQVFMNLLRNGVQAIPEDQSGALSIYTENAKNEVIIRIKDSGLGMADHIKEKIFEPFFTTKDVGVGSGLGLSISYGIIEEHNGSISVKSEEGKGSEFTVRIPKV